MGSQVIVLPPDAVDNKNRLHHRERTVTVAGSPKVVQEPYVIVQNERVASAKCAVATFRTPGLASTPHNLFSLENTAGSGVLVAVRRLAVQCEVSAATAYLVAATTRLFRGITVPTGGSALTKHVFDSAQASAANVVARGASSADGTAAAIVYALPAGNPMWSQPLHKLVTAVGQWIVNDDAMVPNLCQDDPIILRAGQSILVANVGAAATHLHFTVSCVWEEFTLP